MATYKLISCNVFQRELCAAIAESPNVVDPEFLELALHENSESLRERLQARMDAVCSASEKAAASRSGLERLPGDYDAILLGYGLCGNGLSGLRAGSLPVVLARAHDCCTVLLGSRSAFLESFGDNLSAPWSSAGYIERGSTYFRASDIGKTTGLALASRTFGIEYAELAEKYGEENARYVWDTMHPPVAEKELRYIETAETAGLGYAETMRARAAAEGKDFLLIPGSSRLLRALVAGSWDESEFLVLPPGSRLVPLYDHEVIFRAEPGPA
jgi:hypothetical protein